MALGNQKYFVTISGEKDLYYQQHVVHVNAPSANMGRSEIVGGDFVYIGSSSHHKEETTKK